MHVTPFLHCTSPSPKTSTSTTSTLTPTNVMPLHIWTVVSGSFRRVPCLSITLFTSPHCPAWHAPYICGGKSQPSRDYPTFHLVFKEKKVSTPAAGYLMPGQSFATSRQKHFGVLDQACSLMSPIWTGNKVMLFTLHKISTWICSADSGGTAVRASGFSGVL